MTALSWFEASGNFSEPTLTVVSIVSMPCLVLSMKLARLESYPRSLFSTSFQFPLIYYSSGDSIIFYKWLCYALTF